VVINVLLSSFSGFSCLSLESSGFSSSAIWAVFPLHLDLMGWGNNVSGHNVSQLKNDENKPEELQQS
jgi:hypothetical protein